MQVHGSIPKADVSTKGNSYRTSRANRQAAQQLGPPTNIELWLEGNVSSNGSWNDCHPLESAAHFQNSASICVCPLEKRHICPVVKLILTFTPTWQIKYKCLSFLLFLGIPPKQKVLFLWFPLNAPRKRGINSTQKNWTLKLPIKKRMHPVSLGQRVV